MTKDEKIVGSKPPIRALVVIFLVVIVFTSCGDKRSPGRVYMPDMSYSRAYEANTISELKQQGINYLNYPVKGTVRRGDIFAYTLPNDSNGYRLAAEVKDPLPPLDSIQLLEAKRLYNINCGICHGENMDAQGPLATSGKVGGIANLRLDQYVKQPVGQMFHVVTYGKGNMGSYSSQLNRTQRWMVVQYVKSEQAKGAASQPASNAATDSTAKK